MSSHTSTGGYHSVSPAYHMDVPHTDTPKADQYIIASNSLKWGGTHNKTHSLSKTPVKNELDNTHLAKSANTKGSLTELKKAADEARKTFTTPNTAYSVPSKHKADSDSALAVLKSGGGVYGPYYRIGTIHANCRVEGPSGVEVIDKKTEYNSPNNGRVGKDAFSVTFAQNFKGITPQHANSENSELGAISKVDELLDDTGIIDGSDIRGVEYNPAEGINITPGTKITKADGNAALKRIVKITHTFPSNFNMSYTGTMKVNYAEASYGNTSHSSTKRGAIHDNTVPHTDH